MVVRRRRPGLGAALIVGLLLAGCDATDTSDGPLQSLDDPGATVCTPQQSGTGLAVIAISDLQVTGDDSVAVADVSLIDAQGLEVVAFDFGDFEDPTYRVVGPDYESYGPPEAPELELESGHSYTVKVGLEASPEGGAAEALAIEYTVAGQGDSYVVQTHVRMEVVAAGEVCDGA